VNFHAKRLVDEPKRLNVEAKRVKNQAFCLDFEGKRLAADYKRMVCEARRH